MVSVMSVYGLWTSVLVKRLYFLWNMKFLVSVSKLMENKLMLITLWNYRRLDGHVVQVAKYWYVVYCDRAIFIQ
jgi:hypothetical protein